MYLFNEATDDIYVRLTLSVNRNRLKNPVSNEEYRKSRGTDNPFDGSHTQEAWEQICKERKETGYRNCNTNKSLIELYNNGDKGWTEPQRQSSAPIPGSNIVHIYGPHEAAQRYGFNNEYKDRLEELTGTPIKGD